MGAFRIKSNSDLEALRRERLVGTKAASQIQATLNELQYDAKASSSIKRRPRRSARWSDSDYEQIANCSVLPPKLPADALYQGLVRRFGRFYSGGEVVWELIPFADRSYRADAALPRYRIAIEFDGWQSHGQTLDGFKADHRKQLHFSRRGWILLRVCKEQVEAELDDVLDAVAEAVGECRREEVTLKLYPMGWSKLM